MQSIAERIKCASEKKNRLDKITENLLKEFDILVEVKQKATAFNASGGIFRPERVSLGTPDLYEQIASSSSRQFAYKTVLIADCTIPNPFIDLRTFRYAVEFVQVLCARTKVYVWNGEEAILLNSQQVNQGQFAVLSQTLEPISPEALQRFRATHQLQLNNSIVLDHRNFQMMANVMGIGHTGYKKDSPRLDNIMFLDREDFEQKTIGPLHVSVKFINSMPPNTRSKFAATLQAQGQPLHLLIDFSNLSKMGEQHLAAIPPEFHEVIIYFERIDSDFIEDFRKLMRNIPEAQLIGLIQLHEDQYACEESDALIAEIATQFTSLKYLSLGFCYDNIEQSLNRLDLRNHHALQLFSLLEVRANWDENPQRDNTLLHDHLLDILPENVRSLILPAWTFSFEAAQEHLGKRLTKLTSLMAEPDLVINFASPDSLGERMSRLEDCEAFSLVSHSGLSVTPIKMRQKKGHLDAAMARYFAFERPLEQNILYPVAPSLQGSLVNNWPSSSCSYTSLRIHQPPWDISKLLESRWIDIDFSRTKDWKTCWEEYSKAFQSQCQVTPYEKRPPLVSVRLSFVNCAAPNLWYLKKILGLLTRSFHQIDSINLVQPGGNDELVSADDSDIAQILRETGAATWNISYTQTSQESDTVSYFSSTLNDVNDFYQKPKNLTTYYRKLFTCLNNPSPDEEPNFYIISALSSHSQYLPVHPKYLPNTDNIGEAQKQIPRELGNVFLGTYHEEIATPGNHWIALPVPSAATELLEFHCDVPYSQPLYYCLYKRQYFVQIQTYEEDAAVNFSYLILSKPNSYQLIESPSAPLEESEASLSLMRLLRFEDQTDNTKTEISAHSMQQFISACQHLGLRIEDVVSKIIQYFQNFKDETLEVDDDAPNVDTALFTQRRGVCRHRAKLAYKVLKALVAHLQQPDFEKYDFVLVKSDIHAFIQQIKITKKVSDASTPNAWPEAHQDALADFSTQPGTLLDDSSRDTVLFDNLEAMDWNFGYSQFEFERHEPVLKEDALPYEYIEVTTICLGGAADGNVIAFDDEFEEYSSNSESESEPGDSGVKPRQHKPSQQPESRANILEQKAREIDITKIDNPFLKPYKRKTFDSNEELCVWLNNYQQPRPLLLVINDWKTWSKTKRGIRHRMQKLGRLFASISNFDDIALTKLPNMQMMPLQTFIAASDSERPLSSLGEILYASPDESPILWVDIRDYSPALINPLFDHRRLLKGLQLPEHVIRIGVIDSAQFAEMGDDFISRFGKIVHTSFDFRDEKQKVIPNDNMEVDIRRAEFYFDDPQQSFSEFAGKFEFYGEEIRYIPGWIERCVTDNIDEITLYNSPVGMASFDTLLQALEEGLLPTPFADIPVRFSIRCRENKLPSYDACLQLALEKPAEIDFVLHTNNFQNLVGNTTVLDQNSRFITQQSHLTCTPKTNIQILVVGKLNPEQWIRLGDAGKKYGKALRLYFTAFEDIPSFFNAKLEAFAHSAPTLASLCPRNIDWVVDREHQKASQMNPSLCGIYIDANDTIDSIIGSIQKGATPSGFVYRESELITHLRQGREFLLFGSPNIDVFAFFTSLLCSTPYLLVNGEALPITQPISLRFAPQPQLALFRAECTTSQDNKTVVATSAVRLGEPEALHKSIAEHPITTLRHTRNVDALAMLMPSLKTLSYAIYRDHKDIPIWLSAGGLFVINCLSEAPKDMLQLVRKFHYQQAGTVLWKQYFFKTATHTHRMLIADYENSSLLIEELQEIPNLQLNLDAAYLAADYYQRKNRAFYTEELSRFMPVELCSMLVQLLQNPQTLQKDKALRQTFWAQCRDALKSLCGTLPFIETLTPSQIPMALLLMLHLQMGKALANHPEATQYARGLVLEGPPGVGKTRVIFALLHALGYEDKLALGDKARAEKPGFVSAPTDDIIQCRQAISLAKEHGYVLILDEINTLSLEEGYLDCKTVMNQVRDFLSNTEAHRSILIASQNPSETFYGRNALNFLAYCFKAIAPAATKQDFEHLAKSFTHRDERLSKQMKDACRLLAAPKHRKRYYPPNVRTFLSHLEHNNPAKREAENVTGFENPPSAKRPKF